MLFASCVILRRFCKKQNIVFNHGTCEIIFVTVFRDTKIEIQTNTENTEKTVLHVVFKFCLYFSTG